ncbi:hypothetical protein F53441_364 [Fusarium austroafricanum]|uniref:Uncharacterized protein n=1 Tax=Fusarium austroafricanum TaxID=2364996 RepID=A0A8H4P3G6_9HYPO|nr:hypothetical protein F53441_364 [Fusarium austroafricanum]
MALLASRMALLNEFVSRFPQPAPVKWLWLQISCYNFDPFDALYRPFGLLHIEYFDFVESSVAVLSTEYFHGSLYFCIDDAQVTLKGDDKDKGNPFELLEIFCASPEYIHEVYHAPIGTSTIEENFDDDSQDLINPVSVLATSSTNATKTSKPLDLEEDDNYYLDIEENYEDDNKDGDSNDDYGIGLFNKNGNDDKDGGPSSMLKWKSYCLHGGLPFIMTTEEFTHLYQKHMRGLISRCLTQRTTPAGKI